MDVSPARSGELPGVQVSHLAKKNLKVGLVVALDRHLSQVAVGQELHARLEKLHGGNFQAFLALVQTGEHLGLFVLVQEHRQTSQVASVNWENKIMSVFALKVGWDIFSVIECFSTAGLHQFSECVIHIIISKVYPPPHHYIHLFKYLPEIVLHLALRALPAGANSKGGVDALGRMQRPVVNDFRVLLLGLELLAINKELDVWELDGDGIVMPLIVTNLKVTQKYYVSSFDLTAYRFK